MIRVVIADDHVAVRTGLRMLLESDGRIEVVGKARDGDEAITAARSLCPDVMLMDVRMPGTDGITSTAILAEDGIRPILILTTFDTDDYVFSTLRAGADGFILKSASADDIIDAVHALARGDSVLAPEVTSRVLAAFRSDERLSRTSDPLPP